MQEPGSPVPGDLFNSFSVCMRRLAEGGGIRNFGSRSAAGLLKRGELGLLCAGRGQRCRSLPILPEGSYHLYDYQFFFRNLQQNVEQRINSYMEDILDKAE